MWSPGNNLEPAEKDGADQAPADFLMILLIDALDIIEYYYIINQN
jgi:hypothetical protein